MLAGLQLSYLIFGLHGLRLWQLEKRRDTLGRPFDERLWYPLGWIGSLLIFVYTIAATTFVDRWAWLQFTIVSLALLANWATTRKWTWSWPLWLMVNSLQAVYFHHYELWGQFALQFVLFAMSVYGWRRWRVDAREPEVAHAAA
jgi:nicotinamide mononucleotide transporter